MNRELNYKMQLQQEQYNKTIQEYQNKYKILLEDIDKIRAVKYNNSRKKEA